MFGTRLASGIVLILIALVTLSLGGPVLALTLLAISLIAYRELTKALNVADEGGNRPEVSPESGNRPDAFKEGEKRSEVSPESGNRPDAFKEGGKRSEVSSAVGNRPDASQENGKRSNVSGEGKKSGGKWNLLEIAGLLGVIVYYAAVYFSGAEVFQLMCIVGVFMAEMLIYVATFPRFRAEQVVGAVFAFLYAPVMLSFVYLTRAFPQGIYIVWMILISSWGSDTCAYAVGMLIGKKKIFPVLSPKKSLEGCIGGVVGAALIGALYGHFFVEMAFPDQTVKWILAFICGVGAVMSQAGDLAASAIKRNHNIKDYGHLIPGHGGIMDRFDSMIVTAPMIYFLTVLMIRF